MPSYTSPVGNGYQLKLTLNTVSQNVQARTSDVSWVLSIITGHTYYNARHIGNVVLAGTTVWNQPGATFNSAPSRSEKVIASGRRTYTHNAAGDYALSFSAALRTENQGSSWSLPNRTLSGTYNLPRIGSSATTPGQPSALAVWIGPNDRLTYAEVATTPGATSYETRRRNNRGGSWGQYGVAPAPNRRTILDLGDARRYSDGFQYNTSSTRVNITGTTRYNAFPDAVKLASGRIVCVYSNFDTHYGPGNPFVTRSDDDGQTWTTPVGIFPGPDHVGVVGMANRGSVIWVAFMQLASPTRTAWICQSNNGGVSWTTPVQATGWENMGWIYPCALEWIDDGTDQGQLLMTSYGPDGVLLMVSLDSGATWTRRSRVIQGASWEVWTESDLTMLPDGRLMMLLRSDTNNTISMLTSTNLGVTWSAPRTIFTRMSGLPRATLLENDVLLVTLRDLSASGMKWRIGFSDDYGETWRHRLAIMPDNHRMMYGKFLPRPGGGADLVGSSDFGNANTSAQVFYNRLAFGPTSVAQYEYQGRAVNAQGPGPWTATRAIDLVYPADRPSTVWCKPISGNRIEVVVPHTRAKGTPVTTYFVWSRQLPNGAWVKHAVNNSTRRLTFTRPNPDASYEFRGQAQSAAGSLGWSDPGVVVSPAGKAVTVRHGGVYTRALVFVRVSGVWRRAVPWVRHNGVWVKLED